MALKTYYLHPVSVASTTIDGILSCDFDPGAMFDRPITDGNVDPFANFKTAVNARATWSTHAIATALGVAGFSTAAGAVVLEDAQITAGAKISGSNHNKVTMAAARVFPRSLTCRQDGHAVLTQEAIAYVAAGGNESASIQFDQALTSFTPGSDEVFTIGPVSIEGTAIEGVEGINIAFGIGELIRRTDGFLSPKAVDIQSRLPVITLDVSDLDQLDAVVNASNASGIPISTGIILYFRKRDVDGTFVADGTAEHVKVTIAAGTIKMGAVSGTYPRSGQIIIEPRRDAAASIQIDNASAIT